VTRRYEYRWFQVNDPAGGGHYFNSDASELNRLGAEGWHVVASYVNTVGGGSPNYGDTYTYTTALLLEREVS
jgi:hypothetical protein